MTSAPREAAVLDLLLPKLREEGYEVFLHPPADLLPSFMSGYSPDAIALKPDRKLAIEVVADGKSVSNRLTVARALLDKHPDWQLRVYLASDVQESRSIDLTAPKEIGSSLREIERLLDGGFTRSALLQGWATLEAAVRAQSPHSYVKPQTVSGLLEAVASEGVVTPDEADRLREAGTMRNRVAHGDLATNISPQLVEDIVRITKTLLDEHLAA